jgi:hypothetical protein
MIVHVLSGGKQKGQTSQKSLFLCHQVFSSQEIPSIVGVHLSQDRARLPGTFKTNNIFSPRRYVVDGSLPLHVIESLPAKLR